MIYKVMRYQIFKGNIEMIENWTVVNYVEILNINILPFLSFLW